MQRQHGETAIRVVFLLALASAFLTLFAQQTTARSEFALIHGGKLIAETSDKTAKYHVNDAKDRFEGIDVEVGDNASADFKPVVKLKKWADSEFVSVEYEIPESPKAKNVNADKINLDYSGVSISLYPLENSSDFDGGFEYELILAKKPDTNAFNFSLNYSDVDFFYQPPVYEEVNASEYDVVNETHAVKDNITVIYRPVNAVGSYAVYSRGKANNEYKTGKLFHIYRPKITDAEGNSIWGTMSIANGTLAIMVDQNWLDKAKYPVVIDPTFGYTTAGTAGTTSLEGIITGSQFTGALGIGTSITAYFNPSSTAFTTRFALYLHSDSSFVANTTVYTGGTGAAWRTQNFITNPSLSAVDYVIVAWSQSRSGTDVISYDAGSANQGHTQTLTYGTWPNPATFSHNNNKYSIYANYSKYGTLNVTLNGPAAGSSTLVTQNTVFLMNATVTCSSDDVTAVCGQVNGTARYNSTSANPNAAISTTLGATPFYVLDTTNPLTCGDMNASSAPCQLNWTVNATGAAVQYYLDVNFTSNYSAISPNDTANFQMNITAAPFTPSYAFTVTVLGQSPTYSNETNYNATPDIYFNISTKNAAFVYPCANADYATNCQTGTLPVFNYSNTGNVAINLTLNFSAALPSGIEVYGNSSARNGTAYSTLRLVNGTCEGGCFRVAQGLNWTNNWAALWLWANFTGMTGGNAYSRVLQHYSNGSA